MWADREGKDGACEARARPVNYSNNQHYSSHVGIYSVIVARIFMTRDTPTYSRDGRRGGG